jgi:hypothetical protein
MFVEEFAKLDKVLEDDYDITSLYYFEDENLVRDQDYKIVFDVTDILTPTDLYILKKTRKTIYKIDREEEIWYEIIHSDSIGCLAKVRELRDLLDYDWLFIDGAQDFH